LLYFCAVASVQRHENKRLNEGCVAKKKGGNVTLRRGSAGSTVVRVVLTVRPEVSATEAEGHAASKHVDRLRLLVANVCTVKLPSALDELSRRRIVCPFAARHLTVTSYSNQPQHVLETMADDGSDRAHRVRAVVHPEGMVGAVNLSLAALGISHCFALKVHRDKHHRPTWERVSDDPFAIVGSLSESHFAQFLYDVLIDMAMVHAVDQPWSWLRTGSTAVSATELARMKVAYATALEKQPSAVYGDVAQLGVYVSLWSLCGSGSSAFDKYISHWHKLSEKARQTIKPTAVSANMPSTREATQDLVNQLLSLKRVGGQLSRKRITQAVTALDTRDTRYEYYFVVRTKRPRGKNLTNRVRYLMQSLPRLFWTEKWAFVEGGRRDEVEALTTTGCIISLPIKR
jgi:hypothetical protein